MPRARERWRWRGGAGIRAPAPALAPGIGAVLAATLALGGCGSGPTEADGSGVPTAELTFLRPATDAPALLTTDTTLVATRGESFRVELYYEPDPGSGSDTGDRFLRFELEPSSLHRYPEDHPRAGALFEQGDTITIHIRVPDDTLMARLEPTGLEFDPDAPAELELSYVNADPDFDGDGEDDPELEEDVDLWRQEAPGEDWFRIGRIQDLEFDEIEAILTSFSRYAVAI